MKDREYRVNNSRVRIIFGDIMDSRSEVIVSSDDSNISMGGGVSGSIRRREGTEAIVRDVRKYVPAEIGDVVVSTAGTLPQKYIFHVITINLSGFIQKSIPENVTEDEIRRYIIGHSIDKCFQLMHALEIKSIAFPQIGVGVAGIPLDLAACVMSEAICRNLRKTNKSYEVELYLYDRFGRAVEWDYLPVYEQFSAQSAVSRLLSEQVSDRLVFDGTSVDQPSATFPGGEMDIFISYSRVDSAVVREIYEMLEKSSFKCWLDVDGMYSGISYKKVIVDAIKNSKIILFMSSVNSNKSRNVVSEVSVAVEYDKKIIPVRLDDTPYSESIEYDIINYDYVVYDKSGRDASFKELLKKIVSTLKMI